MARKILIVGLMMLPICLLAAPVAAQGEPDAWPNYELHLRTGPGKTYPVITTLAARTELMLEARNVNTSWVLGHTTDGAFRGWMASLYLSFSDGFNPVNLPLSEEILLIPNSQPAAGSDASLQDVSSIDLHGFPIVPGPTGTTYRIYETGRALGNNPHVLAKIGDCGTSHPDFLKPFAWGTYDLGNYAYLQGVISYFGESLGYSGQAADGGFVADTVINPIWANPAICNPGESVLQCEYRIYKPGVAVIMFGTNDLQRRTPEQFYNDLCAVVDQSIRAGVIPILSTFPEYHAFPSESILFNQIVVRVALDYDVPLINLWLALEPLPGHGMTDDGHMTGYVTGGAGYLNDQNLQMGFTMRNLVVLQTLDVIWQNVLNQ